MSTSKKHFYENPAEGLPELPGITVHQGRLDGTGLRFGIVAARFNIGLTGALVTSAVAALIESGVKPSDIEVVWVPGSFEIPLALQRLADRTSLDALIACGVVIEGATRHADLIMNSLTQSLTKLSLELDCPVIDAVVSARTPEQAEARCLGGRESRGAYAARAALEVSTTFSPIL